MIARDLQSGRATAVSFEGERLEVRPADAPPDAGLVLAPGLVDIQVNGFAGVDLNDARLTPDAAERMVARLHAVGVTRFLPTVITHAADHMARCLRLVVAACRASPAVARAVAGVHLEGPFLSAEDGARGAHPREHVRPPDPELFGRLQAAADGRIRLVTLAPERPGSPAFIRWLREQGVVVALGHTLADSATVAAAVEAGAVLATHLGNGVPATLPRHPNPIWDQLAEDRLYASAIFDGHHLSTSVMRVLLAVKGVDRLVLTSDAVALAGMEPGVYRGQVGGEVELHPDGRLTMLGTSYLAGSAGSLLDGVRTALEVTGCTLAEAVAMASRTPRRLLGLPEADERLLLRYPEGSLTLLATAVDGRVVHRAPGWEGE